MPHDLLQADHAAHSLTTQCRGPAVVTKRQVVSSLLTTSLSYLILSSEQVNFFLKLYITKLHSVICKLCLNYSSDYIEDTIGQISRGTYRKVLTFKSYFFYHNYGIDVSILNLYGLNILYKYWLFLHLIDD